MAEGKTPVIRAARRVRFDIEAVLAALSTNNEE